MGVCCTWRGCPSRFDAGSGYEFVHVLEGNPGQQGEKSDSGERGVGVVAHLGRPFYGNWIVITSTIRLFISARRMPMLPGGNRLEVVSWPSVEIARFRWR